MVVGKRGLVDLQHWSVRVTPVHVPIGRHCIPAKFIGMLPEPLLKETPYRVEWQERLCSWVRVTGIRVPDSLVHMYIPWRAPSPPRLKKLNL